jgi:hypothetical protein
MIRDVFGYCAKCGERPVRIDDLECGRDRWWKISCVCGSRWVWVAGTSERL